jgi:serralysin
MRRRIYRGTDEADVLRGSRHADFLFGRAGDDRLFGRGGNDALFGGAGNDRLDGGAGFDTADYRGAITGVNANLTTGVASDGQGGTDRLISIEGLTGSRFEDTLVGDAGANTLSSGGGGDLLSGMGGDDLLRGGEGADTFNGGEGFDIADYSQAGAVEVDLSVGFGFLSAAYDRYYGVEGVIGSDFNDALTGWRDDNLLVGGGGNDYLTAGEGNDRLVGGAGDDTMYGGRGADTFLFLDARDVGTDPAGTDMIVDFNHAEGDRIDLSAIDADVTSVGQQAFTFIGDSGFTNTAGELRYAFVENHQTVLMADVDGDGLADGYIRFAGAIDFTAADLILG